MKKHESALPRAHGFLGGCVLFILTLIAFYPAWRAGFIWDDDMLLTNSPYIKAADGLHTFWFTSKATDYFPLTLTSFWCEFRLWGLNPIGYHIVNIALHGIGAILFWRVLLRLKIPG